MSAVYEAGEVYKRRERELRAYVNKHPHLMSAATMHALTQMRRAVEAMRAAVHPDEVDSFVLADLEP